ncbi:trypsin-like peptidase domain-containing protein [Planctomycetota bacterium]|nr:trypsin-like peptidase domain-containing protein [Planctomycetota bacterium]
MKHMRFTDFFSLSRGLALVVILLVSTQGHLEAMVQVANKSTSSEQDLKSQQVEVKLVGGALVRGRIVKETGQQVFIDIGPTIVSLPKNSIGSMNVVSSDKNSEEKMSTGTVYTTGKGIPLPLEEAENIARGSVVRVLAGGGLGSGFIINENGMVITNVHVVEGQRDVQLTVYLDDAEGGSRKQQIENVEIVALNPFLDLALLRIPNAEKYPLRPVKMAASDGLDRSQKVFAVGTPRGFERTVSEGIVSDPYRSFAGQCYIQTTTPINPGNSGGALFNEAGEVVGVTNMKILQSEGLNFAIPLDQVKFFIDRRESFLFDESQPNTGVRYLAPPKKIKPGE